ncbi:unnamed protein product, partial [marine sediment metagenome]
PERQSGSTAEDLRQRLSEDQSTAEAPVSEALARRIVGLEAQFAQQQAHVDLLELAEPDNLSIDRNPIVTCSTAQTILVCECFAHLVPVFLLVDANKGRLSCSLGSVFGVKVALPKEMLQPHNSTKLLHP